MSLNSHGSTFTMPVPGMIAVDNKTGKNIELKSEMILSSTTLNDLESTKQAFLELMEIFVKTPQFELMFRELNSEVILVVSHSVHTSI